MHAEDPVTNNCSHRQVIKSITNILPQLNIKFPLDLIIKAIYLVNFWTLVIPSKHEKVVRMLDFIRHQQAKALQRTFPTIDIITKKKVTLARWVTNFTDKRQQVTKLPMDITTYIDWRLQL